MTMPVPGAPGINLTSPTPTTRPAAVAAYVGMLDLAYGAQIGQSYQNYANAHPNQTAYNALQSWANTVAAGLGPGLAKAIQAFAKAQGKATGQIAVGTGLGAAAASKDILGGFDLGSWFLRIGEILIGLVLIGVGLAKITNAVPIATKIASVVK
jgi:hypothetical protein